MNVLKNGKISPPSFEERKTGKEIQLGRNKERKTEIERDTLYPGRQYMENVLKNGKIGPQASVIMYPGLHGLQIWAEGKNR